jgi:DNA-binding sugar fermentation-stimulating protein
MNIYNIPNLIQAQIISRPSKQIKTGYVSDIVISQTGENALAHTPSLGCAGYVEAGSIVYVIPLNSKTSKCKYSIELALYEEKDKQKSIIIGVNPKLSEIIAQKVLENNLLENMKIFSNVKSQVTVGNSRFDFIGLNKLTNKPYICEVKNVSIADYIDISNKERKKFKLSFQDCLFENKIALFPDCQRKLQTKPISDRALKHIQELQNIKLKDNDIMCILLYVVQREDVSSFAVSSLDPTYRNAIQEGWQNNVHIRAIQVQWIYDIENHRAKAYLINDQLPVILYDDYNNINLKQ